MMMIVKMFGQTREYEVSELCRLMTELAKAANADGKDWNEYLKEIGFEIVK